MKKISYKKIMSEFLGEAKDDILEKLLKSKDFTSVNNQVNSESILLKVLKSHNIGNVEYVEIIKDTNKKIKALNKKTSKNLEQQNKIINEKLDAELDLLTADFKKQISSKCQWMEQDQVLSEGGFLLLSKLNTCCAIGHVLENRTLINNIINENYDEDEDEYDDDYNPYIPHVTNKKDLALMNKHNYESINLCFTADAMNNSNNYQLYVSFLENPNFYDGEHCFMNVVIAKPIKFTSWASGYLRVYASDAITLVKNCVFQDLDLSNKSEKDIKQIKDLLLLAYKTNCKVQKLFESDNDDEYDFDYIKVKDISKYKGITGNHGPFFDHQIIS